MAIDSHIHVNSKVVESIENSITKIKNDKNIESVINVGLDIETSKECINISNKENKFYNAIGIHPLYSFNEYDKLITLMNEKTVAIGEIGLDNTKNNYYEQREYFIKQIFIANHLKLPVIIHSNNTNKEIIDIFENYVKPKYGCVFHCFQPDLDTLKYIIDNGYYISFAGKITYKNAKKSIEIIKEVPLSNFLIETDSPYISPEPFRDKPNQSSNIIYIINKISEIKGLNYSEIEKITSKNTKVLFKKMR